MNPRLPAPALPVDSPWVYNGISRLQLHAPHLPFLAPEGDAGIGFVPQAGCALVPGPPIAPRSTWRSLVDAFQGYCHSEGLAPVFCGLGAWGRDFFRGLGYHTVKVGDEAVLPLEDLTLQGKKWREVRAALNRARRREIAFRWVSSEERRVLDAALRQVSHDWLAAHHYPELQFALGNYQALHDPQTRLALAEDLAGRIVGFATWVPVPTRHGWMLDLMRYRPGVMAGLMDFILAQSMLDLRAEGYTQVSLGGAPFSNMGTPERGLTRLALDAVFRWVHVPYNMRSLAHFKSKFNPRWEPLYLACEPRQMVVLALLAVAQATLPGTSAARLLWDAIFARG